MGILKESIFGSSLIGIYLAVNNKFLLYPTPTPPEKVELYKNAFPKDFPFYSMQINHSTLIGAYVVMNSNGIIVPTVTLDNEMDQLKEITKKHDMNICGLSSKDNAFGNLILANDHGAIISADLKKDQKKIRDVLGVDVLILDYAATTLTGSSGITNNNGCCVHPLVEEEEAKIISDFLKVPIDVSTINQGNPYIHCGALANDFGGIFGRDSTGPEMMRLTNMLKL